jgi:membrane complex biogenesis BtpA family protein
MHWIKETFGTDKPIIAMCHLEALPGDPAYVPDRGLDWVIERARINLTALQEGGVDAVMFSNEASLPYLTTVEPITTVTMARIIGELHSDVRVPFGVNVLWDAIASIDLAVATGASFVREIFTGIYGSDFGLWNTSAGEAVRHQRRMHGDDVRLLFNIVPEAAAYLGNRKLIEIARSTVFNAQPDALCVSGLTAGVETSLEAISIVKEAVPGVPVFANTGVQLSNVPQQLSVADGAVVGTTFKRNGYIWNEVDPGRVAQFMKKVREIREGS